MKSTLIFIFFSLVSVWPEKCVAQKKSVSEIIEETTAAIREARRLKEEAERLAKSIKTTWRPDTSRNIKYRQIPDYRSREDVSISKKQKIKVENGEFVGLSWNPIVNFESQVFPSFIISWAQYKGPKNRDMGSSLGFYINTSLSNFVLKWEIEAVDKSYFSIDSGYIDCDELRNTYRFMPKIAWNFRNLVKHETAAPLNVYFRLIDPKTGNKVEKLERLNIRSINDCVTYYDGEDYSEMFVAFANEDHPEIDKILKEALDTKMVNQIDGYQAFGSSEKWSELTPAQYQEAKKKVNLQVAAIWQVLYKRGFQYSSITANSGNNTNKLFSQTVRTFDNAMKTSQANCVDGTLVLASILKRIKIKAKLVLVPGHCFLAFNSDPGISDSLTFVETTMLSNKSYLSPDSVKKYQKILVSNYPTKSLAGASMSNKAFFLQYYLACINGLAAFIEVPASERIIIDLAEARKKLGAIPLYSNL